MKKNLILSLLIVPFILAGCSNDASEQITDENSEQNHREKGTIVLNVSTDDTRATSTDYKTYILTIESSSDTQTMIFPEDGKIEDLDAGTYTLTLTSHPDGFTTPEWDSPVYTGTTTVELKAAVTTEATLTCTQQNAGLYFECSAAFLAYAPNVVIKVVQSGNTLTYSGETLDSVGYFPVGEVTITATNDGGDVIINGSYVNTITLDAGELHKVTIGS